MTAEIVENNTRLGWYENVATFPEAMAMLHSEVSEALEAWRERGLEGWFVHKTFPPEPDAVPKPEGVGSEFADILIRLLDYAWRYGEIDLEAAVAECGQFVVNRSFAANINTMHDLISKLSTSGWVDLDSYHRNFGGVLVFLRQLCEEYDIDLQAEYEQKLAYNRTRSYRHGNKRI